MLKKVLVLAALATVVSGGAALPALAAGPSGCLTTNVVVNGTALPTNGTNCTP
jgi:hypothetical protein